MDRSQGVCWEGVINGEGRKSQIVPLIEPSLSFIDSSLQRKLDSPALDVLHLFSSFLQVFFGAQKTARPV